MIDFFCITPPTITELALFKLLQLPEEYESGS